MPTYELRIRYDAQDDAEARHLAELAYKVPGQRQLVEIPQPSDSPKED